jgi:hypothetical protein
MGMHEVWSAERCDPSLYRMQPRRGYVCPIRSSAGGARKAVGYEGRASHQAAQCYEGDRSVSAPIEGRAVPGTPRDAAHWV